MSCVQDGSKNKCKEEKRSVLLQIQFGDLWPFLLFSTTRGMAEGRVPTVGHGSRCNADAEGGKMGEQERKRGNDQTQGLVISIPATHKKNTAEKIHRSNLVVGPSLGEFVCLNKRIS